MDALPVVPNLARKLLTLERRRDALHERILSGRGSAQSLSYDRAEFEALGSAIEALRYHWGVVSGMGGPLEALRELCEAARAPEPARRAEALRRADEMLSSWGA